MLLTSNTVFAASVDQRFLVELNQEEAIGLDLQGAMKLALPTLWKRVVPFAELERANTLQGSASLVLQFKAVKYGVKLVFNPNQVRSYLAKYRITMIPERPHWNLSVFTQGLSDTDEELSRELLNYGHNIADEFGFELSQRGKTLQLIFTPVSDADGETLLHVDVQGAFSADLLSQTDIKADGYASYQLQTFLDKILLEIRDAYSLDEAVFQETAGDILLTIEADHALTTQVMLEQALKRHPAVIALVPTLLQKSRRQYRLKLRDGNDDWLEEWFTAYALTAARQVALPAEQKIAEWLVR